MSMRKPPVSEQRIAFESWFKSSHTSANLVRTDKGYIDNTTRVAWRAWQAARTAIEAAEKQEPVANASAWFALVMNAAAELEDASHCLRDEDAKRVAISGAKHYRDAAKALYTTSPEAQKRIQELEAELMRMQGRELKLQMALNKPAAQPAYDQTALELCDVCGWKTLIPDDGCLNCEREAAAQRQWVGLESSDWNSIGYTTEFRRGGEWADAKLREKNRAA